MHEMIQAPVVLLCFTLFCAQSAETAFGNAADFDKPVPVTQVQGVFGRKVALPCDVSPPVKGDVVLMVLWFLEPSQQPLYSLDARGVRLDAGKRWASPDLMEGRAFFRTASKPAALLLDGARVRDEALYRCRVDFRDSPTRHSHVNLTVVVPPGRPRIYDGRNNNRSSIVAPYVEGSDVILICEVDGGRPTPRLSWFMESTLLDESWLPRPAAVGGGSINRLLLPGVGRQHQHARLVCQAANTDLVQAATTAIILDVQLRPVSVHILNKETRLSAGRNWNIECEATGSNPPAIISWWKSGEELVGEQNEYDTVGVLHFVPTMDDDGKYLTCRAVNPAVPDSTLEDRWLLNVLYAPVVSLKILGAPISGEYLEGQEAILQCGIKANPTIWKITWHHNGKKIQSNGKNIVTEGNDLILSNVSSISSGQYRCTAHNSEGQTQSNPVAIIVRYSPMCKATSVHKIAAPENTPVSLKCSVEAHPTSNITFQWTSAENGDVPKRFINSSGTSSVMTYKPGTDLGYGQYTCKAHNEAGETKKPCLYQVIPPGPPSPPSNCTLQDNDELLSCDAGFDGGKEQRFLAQVVSALDTFTIFLNASSNQQPVFHVPGLTSNFHATDNEAAHVQVIIFSENDLGRSSPVILKNLIYSEKPLRKGGFASFTAIAIDPLLLALLITTGVTITLCCGLFYLLRKRCCHIVPKKPIANGKRQKSRMQDSDSSSIYDEGIDDPDPDLIPNKDDYNNSILLSNSTSHISIVKKNPIIYSCGNLSNYGKIRSMADQQTGSLGRVSREITKRFPDDHRISTLPRRQIVTSSPAIRESCI